MNIQELEARFKEIDERAKAEPVEVNLVGATEASSNLNISVERKVSADFNLGEPTSPIVGGITSVQTETLLDVNLGDVDVPEEYIEQKVHAVFSNQEKIGELPGAVLEQIGASRKWKLREDYTYNKGEHSITAVRDFIYDRSSIPPIFWPLIDKDSLSSVPPLFHDLLYRYGGVLPENQVPPRDGIISPYKTFQRKEVDELFYELMRKSGVKRWRANLAYQAVRNFGMFAWGG